MQGTTPLISSWEQLENLLLRKFFLVGGLSASILLPLIAALAPPDFFATDLVTENLSSIQSGHELAPTRFVNPTREYHAQSLTGHSSMWAVHASVKGISNDWQ